MITIKKLVYTSISLTTMLTSYMFMNAKKRNVVHHQLNVNATKEQNSLLTLFFISDIHRRKIDKKLLIKINTKIDIVIIGGDLAERGVPPSRILKNIKMLSHLGPIYFIWGNNDREAGEEDIRKIIAACGGKILDNESASIPGHPSWGILGTDDPSSKKLNIAATLRDVDRYDNTILVTHTPSLFSKVERLFRPDIMLAGHTHGGQIRVGKLGLFEKGSFQVNNNRAKLISNGYGTSTIPLRLGAVSECHVIKIYY